MLTGSPAIVVSLLRARIELGRALGILHCCWQDSGLVSIKANISRIKSFDRSHCHICGSIFAAASKQPPYSGGHGPPLLCATAVDFWSADVRRRMTPFERCFLPTGNPLGHREHRPRLETGLQYPGGHV